MTGSGVWFAPGRANLMGEHTDYNDGFVLPFALEQGAKVTAHKRMDHMIALTSRQLPGPEIVLDMSALVPGCVKDWTAYPAGVAWALLDAGYDIPGATIEIDSDVPAGAGLSSSAALECSVALALTGLADLDIPRPELVKIARRAENEFAGVPTGIMDQSASLLCTRGHALLLDCQSLATRQVPFDAHLLVIDTRAGHKLGEGEYATRRAECEEAARALAVPSLRFITDCADTAKLSDPVLRRRARHVCTDNQRVSRAVALLTSHLLTPPPTPRTDTSPRGDMAPLSDAASRRDTAPRGDAAPLSDAALAEVGALLTESHASLRDDFEVSWPQADVAVEAALSAGALGARMIGGGFGGSVLALLPSTPAAAPPIRAAIEQSYAARNWPSPQFYTATPSSGACRLT